jgi:hypothetical protein
MKLQNTLLFFLSQYDSRHQLSVGSICPGETVISCLDNPDTEIMSYSNVGSESVTAFFIVDSYTNGVGEFTLEWTLGSNGIFMFIPNFYFLRLLLCVLSLFCQRYDSNWGSL